MPSKQPLITELAAEICKKESGLTLKLLLLRLLSCDPKTVGRLPKHQWIIHAERSERKVHMVQNFKTVRQQRDVLISHHLGSSHGSWQRKLCAQVEPPAERLTKELWESLERKYKTKDAGTKKFVVARFLDYKMADSKNVISQVDAIIEKLPQSWVEFKNYLKHKQKEMSVKDLHAGSSARSNSKGKGKDEKKNDKKGKGKAEYLAPKHAEAVNLRQANMVDDDVDMIAMVSDIAVDNGQNAVYNRATLQLLLNGWTEMLFEDEHPRKSSS
ncbi:hypothetical protein Tco_0782369 [Tanacetum coccineum]